MFPYVRDEWLGWGPIESSNRLRSSTCFWLTLSSRSESCERPAETGKGEGILHQSRIWALIWCKLLGKWRCSHRLRSNALEILFKKNLIAIQFWWTNFSSAKDLRSQNSASLHVFQLFFHFAQAITGIFCLTNSGQFVGGIAHGQGQGWTTQKGTNANLFLYVWWMDVQNITVPSRWTGMVFEIEKCGSLWFTTFWEQKVVFFHILQFWQLFGLKKQTRIECTFHVQIPQTNKKNKCSEALRNSHISAPNKNICHGTSVENGWSHWRCLFTWCHLIQRDAWRKGFLPNCTVHMIQHEGNHVLSNLVSRMATATHLLWLP